MAHWEQRIAGPKALHIRTCSEAKHEREVNKNELGSGQGCEGSCVSDQLDWIVSVVYIGYGKVEILEDVA